MSEFEYLGPYRIGDVIGRGGMGSVYQATHSKSGEVVAVKLIAQHVADDQRFRRRFDGEVETLRRLRHPGIVRLIGYGEEEGRLFYSMELVEGESLQQRIREVKRMGWLPCVDIAIQICAALKHAHDIGVVHRDLKPANLLLTPANEVKLVDFGIAKLFGYGEQTVAGSVLGTADYMAPEQAGDGPITPRTDLYALGSVMYAMMSGRSPFSGKKLTQVIESLKNDRAVPLELINPDIPREVVEIVHHLLEKDPKKRPPTALSVMKRLKATRVGLQRGRTVALENELTRGGDRPVPDSVRPESDTHHSHLTDAVNEPSDKSDADRHSSNQPTDAGLFDDGLSVQSDPRGAKESLPATQASQVETNVNSTDFVTGQTVAPKTRFQSVEGDDREPMQMGRKDVSNAPSHTWIQTASVVSMVAILVGGIYLFVQAIQTPSADDLFAIIDNAEQSGDLTLHENQIERFLVHYPQDDRVEQVQRWNSQADLERTLKQIAAEARRAGGVSRLEPSTQSFYKSMRLRETSVDEARVQLNAWLNVFSPNEESPDVDEGDQETAAIESTPLDEIRRRMQDRETKRFAELAREELERLIATESSQAMTDQRVLALEERLSVARSLPNEAKQEMLKSLIQLYRNDAWAVSIVEKAEAMLQP